MLYKIVNYLYKREQQDTTICYEDGMKREEIICIDRSKTHNRCPNFWTIQLVRTHLYCTLFSYIYKIRSKFPNYRAIIGRVCFINSLVNTYIVLHNVSYVMSKKGTLLTEHTCVAMTGQYNINYSVRNVRRRRINLHNKLNVSTLSNKKGHQLFHTNR